MNVRAVLVGSLLVLAAGCSGTNPAPLESAVLEGADETVAAPETAPRDCVKSSAVLETVATLNLREAPSPTAARLLVIPEGSELSVAGEGSCPENGFYKVRFGGFEGWAYGAWLRPGMGTLQSALSYANTRTDAIARAKTGVGFSYWWGHGRWLETGATSTNKGSCTGSCGSCSHTGSYGADCSGFAAKVWVVPSTNQPVSVDSHPYSTFNFDNEYHGWHNVARGSIQTADAMVQNSDGSGHIFIYEKGDPWGSMYAYECRGCAEGCIYGIRTATSVYKAIGRDNITSRARAKSMDFNGDGITDVTTYNQATFTWEIRNISSTAWGKSGEVPAAGDYNGDGITDIATYNPATFTWEIRNISSTVWGKSGEVPVPGDYNGDGVTDIATYNPATFTWEIRGIASIGWGKAGEIPVPGDYNGDGTTDIATYNPATFTWEIRNISSTVWGKSGEVPVPGDYNGDGVTDIATYNPATFRWELRNIASLVWGKANEIPVSQSTLILRFMKRL